MIPKELTLKTWLGVAKAELLPVYDVSQKVCKRM